MAAVIGSLRAELSATIAQFQQDMGKAADTVKSVSKEFTRVGNDFKKIGAQMQSVGLALTKTITLPLLGVGAAVLKTGIDFETAFAGVKKTVQATEPELKALADGFRNLAKTIPVSVIELARLGEAAGALGIAQGDILDFTRVMALLGVTTNVTSDQAAESIAKIQAIFGAAGKDTSRFASTLVDLGNKGASTEGQILELATRIAGAGNTIGLTQAQVLGFAAAIANVGIDAEAGGSAISRVFNDLSLSVSAGGDDLAKFAQVAGQSASAFAQAFRADAAGATEAFIAGLARIKASGGDLNKTLTDLGFTEIRQADLLRRLAGSGDNLAKSLGTANTAWRENSALTTEAGKRFETTASQLTILWQRIKDVGITLFTAMKPGIDAAIKAVTALLPYIEGLAKAFSALPGSVQLAIIGIAAFAAALGPLLFIAGQLVSSLGSLALAFGKTGIATRVIMSALGLLQKGFGALSVLLGETTGVTVTLGTWIARLAGFFTSLLNPITLTIAAVTALVAGLAILTGHWTELKAVVVTVATVLHDLGTIFVFLAGSMLGDLVNGIGTLIRLFGQLGAVILSDVVDAFRSFVAIISGLVPQWLITLIDKFKEILAWAGRLGSQGADYIHGFAEAVRDSAKDTAASAQQAGAGMQGFWQAVRGNAAGPKTLAELDALGAGFTRVAKSAATTSASAESLKKFKEAVDSLAESLSGASALKDAQVFEAALKRIGGASKLTDAEIDKFALTLDDLIAKYQRLGPAGATVVTHFQALRASLAPLSAELAKKLEGIEYGVQGIADAFEGLESAKVAEATLDVGLFSLSAEDLQRRGLMASAALRELSTQIGVLPNVVPQATEAIEAATESTSAFGQALRDELQSIPQTIANAFTGGGGFIGALKSIASNIGSLIGKTLGAAIGGPLGASIGAALGSLVGPLVGKIKQLFGGPSERELKGRDAVREFEAQIRGLISTMGKAEAQGQTWAEVVIGVREAYLATGRTAEQAEADVKRLWAAEKQGPEAVAKVLASINPALEAHRAQLQKTGREIETLLGTATRFAGELPARFRPALEELARLGIISSDALADLFNPDSIDVEALQRIAEEYGVALSSLGGAFQSARISERAQKILEDFQLLIDSGGDFGGVLTDFGDEIGALVLDAKKFGTALPENFRPLVEQLISAGKLLDENGNKIEDISGLSFGDSIKVGLDAIVDRLDALLEGLGLGIPKAAEEGGDAIEEGVGGALDKLKQRARDAARDIGEELGNIRIPKIEIPIEYVPGELPGTPTEGGFTTSAFTAAQIAGFTLGTPLTAPQASEPPIIVNLTLDGQIAASTVIKQIARGKRGLDAEMKQALGMA